MVKKNTGWGLNHFSVLFTRWLRLGLYLARDLFSCHYPSSRPALLAFSVIKVAICERKAGFKTESTQCLSKHTRVLWKLSLWRVKQSKLKYILLAGLFLIIILCDTAQNKNVLLSEYKERIFYLKQHTQDTQWERGGHFVQESLQ